MSNTVKTMKTTKFHNSEKLKKIHITTNNYVGNSTQHIL